MSLGSIISLKALQNGVQPLLVASIVFKDSITSPTILLLSTHELNATAGGNQPSGISGFPYNGSNFLGRIQNQEVAATQALSALGIDITPTVTLDIIDADKTIWNTYEKAIGFKGATLTLYFIFWDAYTANYSSDYRTIFTGECNPGIINETLISVTAISKLNMNQLFLPQTRIQRRCPWLFPDITNMTLSDATALHQEAADNQSSIYWHCGYSFLASGGNAVGNKPSGDIAYRTCTYTKDSCIVNLGNSALTYTPLAPIERDSANRPTARFGGVTWDPPNSYQSRGYGQPTSTKGFNALNEGKYNDYVPIGWGTYWIDPVVLNISGDANFTAMDVLLGVGPFTNIRHVICNDIDVDKFATDSATQQKQIALQLFWNDITSGDRTGACNRNAIQNSHGDPYGGLKVINVQVPSQLTPTSSIPRIRVLVDGPAIRVYSDPSTFTVQFTTNPAWILMDALAWLGWKYAELNIQSFIDSAAYYDGSISYNGISGFVNIASDGVSVSWVSGNDFSQLANGQSIFINGNPETINTVTDSTHFTITVSVGGFKNDVTFLAAGANSHARFKLGLGISQRTSGTEVIRQIRTACRSILIPDPTTGLLKLVPKRSLAEQQPAPVNGSNYNTQISSYNSSGQVAGGYAAWKFTYSDILPDSSGNSSLSIDQLDTKSAPNKISLGFSDEDNQFQEDSITIVDSQDITRVGRPVEGTISAAGLMSFDQAQRIIEVWLAENFRGNARFDSGGTYTINFKSTFRCQHISVGDIVLMDYPQLGITSNLTDISNNPITGFLARITQIKPATNFETVAITMQYHDDGWYVDTFGQNGINVRQLTQYRNSLTRPSFPWSPYEQQPLAGDALYPLTDWQMGIAQQYDKAAATPLALVHMKGKLPINSWAGNGLPPPAIAAQGTTAATGGTVKAGRTYYGQVCGYDANGRITPPSDPTQPCTIIVPAGANTATLTFPVNNWPLETVKYELFVGILRSKMSSQASGSVTAPNTPSTITITSYQEDTWGIPDVECNSLGVRARRCFHAGTIGAEIKNVTSTQIQISVLTGEPLGTNEFAPDIHGNPYYVMLIGLKDNNEPLPIANWAIASNTGDTFTLAAGIDPTTIDRGDGTTGLQIGDVIVVSMRPTVGSDSDGNYIQDTNLVNSLNPLFDSQGITDASNATPIVITTTDDPAVITGDKVYVKDVIGNTNANGSFFATKLTSTTYALYADAGLTTPISGNGAYVVGGTFQKQDQGLAIQEEQGRELYFAFGTGAGLWYKVKKNTKDKIYIEGDWTVTPDSTSIPFVNAPNWELGEETDNINNFVFDTPITFALNAPNYLSQLIFVQSFTLDGGGNESFRAESPWRILWMFGKPNQLGTKAVTADYDVTSDDEVVDVDSTNGPININLPPAATMRGQQLIIKKISDDTTLITVIAFPGENIDGLPSVVLTQYNDAVTLFGNRD